MRTSAQRQTPVASNDSASHRRRRSSSKSRKLAKTRQKSEYFIEVNRHQQHHRRSIDGDSSSDAVNASPRTLKQTLMDTFLPIGYPHSVTQDYTAYQLWDSVQAFCSTITGLFSTQAMFTSVGVGDAHASSLGDGVAMTGRIVFTAHFAPDLDMNCKTWRFAADIFNDLGMAFSLLAPWTGRYKILIICLAGLLRALCGVCGGATRSALTQHFAKEHNTADVSAKDGSQETVINLVGTVVGTALVYALPPSLVGVAFCLLTYMHLVANYRAVHSVQIPTLNPHRLEILLDAYTSADDGEVQTPKQVAKRERLFRLNCWTPWKPNRFQIRLGPSLGARHRHALTELTTNKFAVCDDAVLIRDDAQQADILEATVTALYSLMPTPSDVKFDAREFISRLDAAGWRLWPLQFSDDGYRIQLARSE